MWSAMNKYSGEMDRYRHLRETVVFGQQRRD